MYDLLPKDTPWLSPVGRLDRDSSGLVLFTNDTQLADAISGESGVAKVYEVDFDAPLNDDAVARMRRGLRLPAGDELLPIAVTFPRSNDRTRARLTLREGKNRQIRRMATACGLTVVRLHRLAIGPVHLGDLALDQVRRLRPANSPPCAPC